MKPFGISEAPCSFPRRLSTILPPTEELEPLTMRVEGRQEGAQ